MGAEPAVHDLPGGHEIVLGARRDVDRALDDVGQLGPGRAQRHLQVGHDLLGLTRHVADRDGGALGIERARACGEDEPANVVRDGGIGVRGDVGELGRADQLDGREGLHRASLAARRGAAAARRRPSTTRAQLAGGMSTVSIAWITPFDVAMSAATIVASLTRSTLHGPGR